MTLVGALVFAFVVSNVAELVHQINARVNQNRARIQSINAYMLPLPLPLPLPLTLPLTLILALALALFLTQPGARMESINAYMRYRGLPCTLQTRIRDYHAFSLSRQVSSVSGV